MTRQTASCRCGQLRATVAGEPVRVSVCHCLDCKKRSGSAFAVQARYPAGQVKIEGRSNAWTKVHENGSRMAFHFCPDCGSDVYYQPADEADAPMAIPLGTFDDPYFIAPRVSVWEERKHEWVEILGEDVERWD